MMLIRTKLKASEIHGIGCFSDEDVEQRHLIWRFDPRIDRVITKIEREGFPEFYRKFLAIYAVKDSNTWVYYGDNARFLNHSERPNLKYSRTGLVTKRDITQGEELTINYDTLGLGIG